MIELLESWGFESHYDKSLKRFSIIVLNLKSLRLVFNRLMLTSVKKRAVFKKEFNFEDPEGNVFCFMTGKYGPIVDINFKSPTV